MRTDVKHELNDRQVIILSAYTRNKTQTNNNTWLSSASCAKTYHQAANKSCGLYVILR